MSYKKTSSHSFIGIDFSQYSIKAVLMDKNGDQLALKKKWIQRFSKKESDIRDKRRAFLSKLFAEFKGVEVHVAVSGYGVTTRRLPFPQMSDAELAEAVKWQMKDHIAYPVDQAISGYLELDYASSTKKGREVVAAAIQAEPLQELIQDIEEARGKVLSVTPSACATWMIARECLTQELHQGVAVVDFGAETTEVILLSGDQISLVREFSLGTEAFVRALMEKMVIDNRALALTREQASQLFQKQGMMAIDSTEVTDFGVTVSQVVPLIQSLQEQLLTEVGRLIDYYNLEIGQEAIKKIYLCGGGSRLPHMADFLDKGLGIQTAVLEYDAVKTTDAEDVSTVDTSFDIAMGAVMAQGNTINLLPPAYRKQRKLESYSDKVWQFFALVVGICLVICLVLKGFSMMLDARIHKQMLTWEEMAPDYLEISALQSEREDVDEMGGPISEFIEQQPLWEGLFKEVSQLVPPDIILTEWFVEKTEDRSQIQFSILGSLLGDNMDNASLSRFVRGLEESLFFAEVRLVRSEMDFSQAEGAQFEIEGVFE